MIHSGHSSTTLEEQAYRHKYYYCSSKRDFSSITREEARGPPTEEEVKLHKVLPFLSDSHCKVLRFLLSLCVLLCAAHRGLIFAFSKIISCAVISESENTSWKWDLSFVRMRTKGGVTPQFPLPSLFHSVWKYPKNSFYSNESEITILVIVE